MNVLKRLYWYIRYRTTDEDRVQCEKEGHEWETVGKTNIMVPEGESGVFDSLPDDEFSVTEGPPLPEGQHTWAPIESSNMKCTRCGTYKHHSTP